MASGGSTDDQKREVAKVANMLFGVPFEVSQVIGETLERATPEIHHPLRQFWVVTQPPSPPLNHWPKILGKYSL